MRSDSGRSTCRLRGPMGKDTAESARASDTSDRGRATLPIGIGPKRRSVAIDCPGRAGKRRSGPRGRRTGWCDARKRTAQRQGQSDTTFSMGISRACPIMIRGPATPVRLRAGRGWRGDVPCRRRGAVGLDCRAFGRHRRRCRQTHAPRDGELVCGALAPGIFLCPAFRRCARGGSRVSDIRTAPP